jgi:16S rRNA (cytidine1402-2'-O)-methyltransferase
MRRDCSDRTLDSRLSTLDRPAKRDFRDENELAPGRLFVVATPIGNLEDITYRAVRVLGEVDVVAAEDTRRAQILLDRYEIRAPELVSLFEGNEARRTDQLRARLAAGALVAVISDAGTPVVSDPGARLIAAAIEDGIAIEAVPGASAALCALVASGLAAGEFHFVGFLPRKGAARAEIIGRLSTDPATVILYEAPGRVAATLADLAAAWGGERRAAVGRELTKLHEEIVRGTLDELAARFAESAPRGECTLVIEGAASGAAAEIDVEAELRALLAEGLGPKQAAQRLVLKTGLSRRALYQLALSLSD